jgi:hypothetical protein
MKNDHQILLYYDGKHGMLGMPDNVRWKLVKWIIPSGSAVVPGDILAHFECDSIVIEYIVVYSGVLRHIMVEGTESSPALAFAAISCDEDQFLSYLKAENSRYFRVLVSLDTLSDIEVLRKYESREDFVLRMIKIGLNSEKNKWSPES